MTDAAENIEVDETEAEVEAEPTPSVVNMAKEKEASNFKDEIEARLKATMQDAIEKKREEISQTMFSKERGMTPEAEPDQEIEADANV